MFPDSSSGYESTDSSESDYDETEMPRESMTRANEHVSARIKSTHALCESLRLIMEIPEMCDLTFLVGPLEIPVHGVRAILGIRSKYVNEKFLFLILKL